MQHECRITVLETKAFEDYQAQYLANPKSGPCPYFRRGAPPFCLYKFLQMQVSFAMLILIDTK